MNIKSLGYRTDFLFNTFDGSVEDKGQHFVAKTESNPNYFWGNLLLFKDPPKKGDLSEWKRTFNEEFSDLDIYHMTFGWDSPSGERGDVEDFEKEGFGFESSVVLTASKVIKPPKFNQNILVYPIEDEADFNRSVEIQISCGRYQIVSTDPSFQRKGVCSTFVFESAKYAFDNMGVSNLVMIADEEYHAAKIYESVGFQPTEKQVGVCWWDKERHS